MKRNSIPFANAVITLFNRVETVGSDGRKTVTWQKREISGCRYREKLGTREDERALCESVSAIIDIPSDDEHVSPGVWAALADRSGKFTLAQGDIIVRGAVPDTISPDLAPRAFLAAYRPRGAVVVTSVTDKADAGEPLGYYRAEGRGA